jgi:dienelactone hydrolase
MQDVSVPVQIMAAEHDEMFPEDRRDAANRIITKVGVPFDYQYFPGKKHGFATRGNVSDLEGMEAMIRAKDCAVKWLRRWLHGL